MKILAFDPGETTGYATLVDGKPGIMGEIPLGSVNWVHFIDNHSPDLVVVENYRIRPGHKRWSEAVPIKVIALLEHACHVLGIKCLLQEPAVKPIGYGWSNMTYIKGKKGTHIQDALAHAFYYYVKHCGGEINIGRTGSGG